jgi:Protein of unknown function (DUF3987)
MKTRHYKDWIAAFVDVFNKKTEAPPRLLFWTAVGVLGGAVTRRVRIDETVFSYYPNWYIVFVAPPGVVTKSSTIGYGTDILRSLDHIYMSADTTTYPAFIRDLAMNGIDLRTKIGAQGEDDEWVTQCAVTAGISEFGTFFKPEDEDMVNGLTTLWDCAKLLVKDTKTAGTDIVEHPFVNILAGTTPKWVHDKIKRQVGGWGLSSRIIFVYEDKKSKYIARPSKMWTDGEYEQIGGKLLEDLKHIADLEGPMIFSDEADALAEEWYSKHCALMEVHNIEERPNEWLSYFYARKQAHVHKLAMTLSLSRRDGLIIEAQDFEDAVRHVDEIENEVPRIVKDDPEPTHASVVEQSCMEKIHKLLIRGAGKADKKAAMSMVRMVVDSSTAERIITAAIARGELKQLVDKGTTWLLL